MRNQQTTTTKIIDIGSWKNLISVLKYHGDVPIILYVEYYLRDQLRSSNLWRHVMTILPKQA